MIAADLDTRIRPGKSHTELEEELHETAHIDYERVAIVSGVYDYPSAIFPT